MGASSEHALVIHPLETPKKKKFSAEQNVLHVYNKK